MCGEKLRKTYACQSPMRINFWKFCAEENRQIRRFLDQAFDMNFRGPVGTLLYFGYLT